MKSDKTIIQRNDSDLNHSEHSGLDVTIILLMFNPILEKCLFTLESVLAQQDVSFEVIVSDDGSSNPLTEKLAAFFESKSFYNYRFVLHEKNQGTVINCFDALKISDGRFVKLISPGDAFANPKSLCIWMHGLIRSGKKWSMGEAYYYINDSNKNVKIVSCHSHPQNRDVYLKEDYEKSVWQYLVLNDPPLGAALLVERKLMIYYLRRLLGKVIYYEDSVFRSIIFDGYLPFYEKSYVIIYEYGTGISTNTNPEWSKKLLLDVRNIEKIIIKSSVKMTDFQKRIIKSLKKHHICNENSVFQWFLKFLDKGKIIKAIRFRLVPRMTKDKLASVPAWWIRLKNGYYSKKAKEI